MSKQGNTARAVGLLTGLLYWFEGESKGPLNREGARKIIREVIGLIEGSPVRMSTDEKIDLKI